MKAKIRVLALVLGGSLALACGTKDPGDDDDDTSTPPPTSTPTGRLLPAKIGASWTYRVTDADGVVSTKVHSIEALEDVGGRKAGVTAFRFRTEKDNGSTVSWQEDRTTSIVRHREQSYDASGALEAEEYYDPGKVRVDESTEHLTSGAAWEEAWTEVRIDPVEGEASSPRSAAWTVEAATETVTVPAGTFTCVRLRRVSTNESGLGSDKTFWFAPGVGKVKETGGKTEELVEFVIP